VNVPRGFQPTRARPLIEAWLAFLGGGGGDDGLWISLCEAVPDASESGSDTAVARAGRMALAALRPFAPEWGVRCGTAIAAVARAAACLCAATPETARAERRRFAALFDACVALFRVPLPPALAADAAAMAAAGTAATVAPEWRATTAASVAWLTALLHARAPFTVQFPADRTDECPVDTLWIFRDAFLMGPMRSGGSAPSSHGAATAAMAASAAAATARSSPVRAGRGRRRRRTRTRKAALHSDTGSDSAGSDSDGDDSDGDPDVDALAVGGASGAMDSDEAFRLQDATRGCEHVPVSMPPAVYARYDRTDTIFTLLHKGWPHKLQPRETINVVMALLSPASSPGHATAPGADRAGARARTATQRAAARRTGVAAVALCRWWAYARLGRWLDDAPLMDWNERAQLVCAVDVDLAGAGVGGATEMTPAQRGAWFARILGDTHADAFARARHVAGVTLALQAVVIESARRLVPLRRYLVHHSRWEAFEGASAAARAVWRSRPHGCTPVPAFFSELMAMAPRDTDPNMWLIHVGRCLRSRNVRAVPLPEHVSVAFRIGVAALPDLMRLAWPLVDATRTEASVSAAESAAGGDGGGGGGGGGGHEWPVVAGMTHAASVKVQHYVGRMTATGAVRPEWDARIPALTMCHALALSEVIHAALLAYGIDAGGCAMVAAAIRDLYVCTTGPRVQAMALVNTIMRVSPAIAGVLVALHNICVDIGTLRSTALDAHTTALQVAARLRRVGPFSGGRDDWLVVCHNCRRPHTLVSDFEARIAPGRVPPGAALDIAIDAALTEAVRCRAAGDIAEAERLEAQAAGVEMQRSRRSGGGASGVGWGGGGGGGGGGGVSMRDHGFRKIAVDVHDMTFMCNQRASPRRELVYPIPMTGKLVWFHSRCYTICPQCGAPMQLNPQLCAYVNFTFACVNCTALVRQLRLYQYRQQRQLSGGGGGGGGAAAAAGITTHAPLLGARKRARPSDSGRGRENAW